MQNTSGRQERRWTNASLNTKMPLEERILYRPFTNIRGLHTTRWTGTAVLSWVNIQTTNADRSSKHPTPSTTFTPSTEQSPSPRNTFPSSAIYSAIQQEPENFVNFNNFSSQNIVVCSLDTADLVFSDVISFLFCICASFEKVWSGTSRKLRNKTF